MLFHRIVTILIALVWLVNGLVCKVLDLVPRHREIVARILGAEHSLGITRAIGFAEILMALWVLSGFARRLNVWTQIAVIVTMNVMEFVIAPDLLLFGRLNIVVASVFVLVIWYNEYGLKKS